MAYFKIGDKDFSNYCQELTIKYRPLYNSQTNAAGNTVVDMINTKRTIEVTFRPMNNTEMAELLNAVSQFDVNISYREPKTNVLVLKFLVYLVLWFFFDRRQKKIYRLKTKIQ